jgi:hypothetical protein
LADIECRAVALHDRPAVTLKTLRDPRHYRLAVPARGQYEGHDKGSER